MELVVRETIPKVGSWDVLSCAEYSELECACQSPPHCVPQKSDPGSSEPSKELSKSERKDEGWVLQSSCAGVSASSYHKCTNFRKEEAKTEKKEGAEDGEQVSKLLPERLTLGHGEAASQSPKQELSPQSTKQESSSRSPKQSSKQVSASSPVKAEVPPLVCISIPRKKQPLSLARAAGEKVSVGFKMEEVEATAVYPSQQDKLLDILAPTKPP